MEKLDVSLGVSLAVLFLLLALGVINLNSFIDAIVSATSGMRQFTSWILIGIIVVIIAASSGEIIRSRRT